MNEQHVFISSHLGGDPPIFFVTALHRKQKCDGDSGDNQDWRPNSAWKLQLCRTGEASEQGQFTESIGGRGLREQWAGGGGHEWQPTRGLTDQKTRGWAEPVWWWGWGAVRRFLGWSRSASRITTGQGLSSITEALLPCHDSHPSLSALWCPGKGEVGGGGYKFKANVNKFHFEKDYLGIQCRTHCRKLSRPYHCLV